MSSSKRNDFFRKLIQNRVLQHALFWSFSFFVLLRMFAYEEEFEKVNLIYTVLFHISLVTVVYINLYILIPRFLKSGRYLTYGLMAILLILLGALLNRFTFNTLADRIFPGYYFISYYRFGEILQFVLAFFAITTLLKLSKGWFLVNAQARQISRLEQEKLNTELQMLKSQLNPHFLFNSLNNLYSLTLEDDPRISEAILQLSGSLRYVLYEAETGKVALEKELEFVRNYVALQTLRSREDAEIELSLPAHAEDEQIAPLLFLPFIENAFKHGLKGDVKGPYVHLSFELEKNRLTFKIENNFNQNSTDDRNEEKGGLGIANARRRLELLYPGRHQLHIMQKAATFIVTLSITLP